MISGIKYKSWKDFPMDMWRWKNFSPEELASRGDGELMIDAASLDKLQALRDLCGKPLIINSAYRSEAHNKAVGGAPASQHLKGKAYDVRMDNHDPHEFEAQARKVGFTGFGYYPKNGFMHIDTGPARTWGTPWPKNRTSPTPQFPAEKPLLPETPKKDSVLGAVGVVASTGALGQLGGLDRYAQIALIAVGAIALLWIVYKRIK